MMWVLLVLFLWPEVFAQQEFYRYDTKQACQAERDRIGFLMAEEYPEAGFRIVCQFSAAQIQPGRT